MKALYIAAATVLLLGCSAQKSSYLEHAGGVIDARRWQVAFNAPTGDYIFSAHSLGIYETHRSFELWLPSRPPDTARYEYSQISLRETTPTDPIRAQLSGGHIEFSATAHKLTIKLQVSGKEFWANGDYPFTGSS